MQTISATPQLIIEAREVVSRPEKYHDRPSLRLLAWQALMQERGQRIDQHQLGRMQRQARLPLAQRLVSRLVMDAPATHPDYVAPEPPHGGRAA